MITADNIVTWGVQGIVAAIVGWLFKGNADLRKEIAAVRDELVTHKVMVAGNYITKADLAAVEQRVVGAIARLEEKLDHERI